MIKRSIWLIVAIAFFAFNLLFANRALAIELDEATRTVPLNERGETVVLTLKEMKKGKQLFINSCSECHQGGMTKTNPNVGLGLETLALATPPRNNIEGLVDYLKNPTTYDGEIEISELHPSIQSADIFPEMRNLTEDDLYALAGHILVQPNILGDRWGGGKLLR
ncbi:MAG: photosystem II cytochrome c-550 [Spirulina sp.]